jgi:hypothetical protein
MTTLVGLRRIGAAASVCVVLAAASSAGATQVFFGTFNGVNGGASGMNLLGGETDFGKFGEIGGGAVDLFHSGDGGVTCGAGITSCLSLESSDGHYGEIRTINAAAAMHGSDFSVKSGATVTLSFELSGNQRGPTPTSTDKWNAGFDFNGDIVNLGPVTRGGAWSGTFDPPLTGGVTAGGFPIAAGTGFQVYTMSFVAPQDMHFIGIIKGGPPGVFTGSDGRGPILDYMAVDITPLGGVPEPATWAMMLLGFGSLGAALRRRRRAVYA